MVRPLFLTLIGYWDGPHASSGWPSVDSFIDPSWDPDDRDMVAEYLEFGQVARAYMGYSACRICARSNGTLELTDGTFVWPEGLRHYVVDHGVRLPDRFVEHARAKTDAIEGAVRDEDWWRSFK
jgi:hypothetical protein